MMTVMQKKSDSPRKALFQNSVILSEGEREIFFSTQASAEPESKDPARPIEKESHARTPSYRRSGELPFRIAASSRQLGVGHCLA